MFPGNKNIPVILEGIKCPNATVCIVSPKQQTFKELILQSDFNDKIEFFEVVFLGVIFCRWHKLEENKTSDTFIGISLFCAK